MHTTLDFSRTSPGNDLGRVLVFLLSLAADDAPQETPDDQQNECEALRELAQRERRDPQDQADLLICDSLQRAKLLATDALTPVVQTMRHAEPQHE